MSERRSIREAALRGDLSKLKDLMRRWAGQAESGRLGWTALMTGSAKGQAEVVRFALDQERTDVNEKGEDGDTPLLRACFWGHCEVVELLLDRGADISLGTSIGYNALVTAAAAGRVRVVALILEKRKGDKELQASLTTALWMACGWGHRDVAKLLLEAGADYTHLSPEHFPVDTCLQLFEEWDRRHYRLYKARRVHDASVRLASVAAPKVTRSPFSTHSLTTSSCHTLRWGSVHVAPAFLADRVEGAGGEALPAVELRRPKRFNIKGLLSLAGDKGQKPALVQQQVLKYVMEDMSIELFEEWVELLSRWSD